MKKKTLPFVCSLNKTERILGLIYLPIHIFLLPLLLGVLNDLLLKPLSDVHLNTIYYLIGFVCLMLALKRGIRKDWDLLLDNKRRALLAMIMAYFLSLVLNYLITIVLLAVMGDSISPVDTAQSTLLRNDPAVLLSMLVFLGPIVEETLFRGVIFGALREKNRTLAYVVTTLVFALYSVWQYALVGMDWTILIYALQIIPVSAALCMCYEMSGSIWVPITYHAVSNAVSLMLLATS